MRDTYQDVEEREKGKELGSKYDEGKANFSLIPPETLEEIAKVFTFGAKKYGEYNWQHVKPHQRYEAAAMRHIIADKKGEKLDPESGLTHLSHAITSLIMLNELKNK